MPTDIEKSKKFEMQTYIKSMQAMYGNAILQNREIYDFAFLKTRGFSKITSEAIISDSRIVKILRYIIAPSISQMKFGQFFGLSTIETLERDRLVSGVHYETLKRLAPKIADFVEQYSDKTRFIWNDQKLSAESREIAETYARNWTCSLIADQNAQTEYRNWRKTQQEASIEKALIDLGYVRSSFSGEISNATDIKIGEYTKERKVLGSTSQKADLAVRRKKDGKLFLIEAKAVGVQVDAFKRVKECCDKVRDWKQNSKLGKIEVISVIAGFFSEANLTALKKAGAHIVWEHNLGKLGNVI